MLKNYLKIALRTIKRHKGYSLINISGLAVGLTTCMLIAMYISSELSFDRYHKNAARICRATLRIDYKLGGYTRHFARFAYDWINELQTEFPEIEALIRFQQEGNQAASIKIGDSKYKDDRWFFTDANVFSVFSFRLLQGNPRTVLAEPFTVVLSQSAARKYFGEKNPLGRVISYIDDRSNKQHPFKVTGIMQDLPPNSHFSISCLASWMSPEQRHGWAYIYLLLKPGTDLTYLQGKMPEMVRKYTDSETAKYNFIELQKLTDIHLHSHLDRELQSNGDIRYVYIFATVGLLVLLIAGFNYTNMATALSTCRVREIGIHKALGITRRQLIGYFLTESITIAWLAFLLSLALLHLISPLFNSFIGFPLDIALVNYSLWILAFGLVVTLFGVLAGLYPALVSSAFQPMAVLSGTGSDALSQHLLKRGRKGIMRRLLVVLQFIISIGLMTATILFYNQFHFLQNKKLGFETNQIIAIKDLNPAMRSGYHPLKNALLRYSDIVDVSAALEEPSQPTLDGGFVDFAGAPADQHAPAIYLLSVDKNFITFMNMDLIAGRDFSFISEPPVSVRNLIEETVIRNYISQAGRYYILNESAVKTLGWSSAEEALGKRINWSNEYVTLRHGPVIGVVKDFHYSTLRQSIPPMVLIYEPFWLFSYLIKVNPVNLQATLDHLSRTWDSIYPDQPLVYEFLDEAFARLYSHEQMQSRVLSVLAILAILIANLGLLGLVSISTHQRVKEIAIRKVHGASIRQIVWLFVRYYTILALMANLFAWPIAWYAANKWLQHFAYRIPIQWWSFILAGGFVFMIACITVSYQAIKVATENPVESLRYE